MSQALNQGGKPRHINGTATTSPAAISSVTPQESAYLHIFNADATNNLLISFDGGATFYTVRPLTQLAGPWALKTSQVRVQASAATVAYQIIWTSIA